MPAPDICFYFILSIDADFHKQRLKHNHD